jgi:hypothetical protein
MCPRASTSGHRHILRSQRQIPLLTQIAADPAAIAPTKLQPSPQVRHIIPRNRSMPQNCRVLRHSTDEYRLSGCGVNQDLGMRR